MNLTATERFWQKVDQGIFCWEWNGSKADGYGRFWYEGRAVAAHRWSYETLVGPIPEGLGLDHLCRNRPCVRPDHLEPVTNQENALRGLKPEQNRVRARLITHCPSGHAYDARNTYCTPKGFRQCRTCWRERRMVKAEMG